MTGQALQRARDEHSADPDDKLAEMIAALTTEDVEELWLQLIRQKPDLQY